MKLFCFLLSVVLAKGKKSSTRPVLSASEGRSLGMPDGTCKNWVVPDYCCEQEPSEFDDNCRATSCYCDAYCCEAGDCCDDYDQGHCAAELGSCFQQTGSVDCPAGLEVNADETACIDIDECAIGTHNCDFSEDCVNLYAEPCVGFEFLPINIKTSWEKAKQICRLAGGELPSFSDEDELALFNTNRFGDNRVEWLGIRRNKKGTKFITTDKKDVTVFEWNNGEPNQFIPDENCVEILGNNKWNDEPCKRAKGISCKFIHVRYC
ncbi:unnamed protein product [Oikopleura dioica]|uniref:C-type lectin domain-containing protein n=1 Tax=Oikopleura dioica TaxID=34765 RepID=E4XB61_OIKDI|nr:unnamed protein product [Oikopleura dioica]